MRLTKLMMAAAAVSMTASPVLAASANPAVKLSVAAPRASADVGKSRLRGGGFFVAIIAVVVIIAGVIIVSDNDDKPDSP